MPSERGEVGVSTQQLARETMAFVLAGGRGSRLMELTDTRAKPAIYFGGKTRIIDFALSNAVNSGIRRIGVATQYESHGLIRHLQRGWSFLRADRHESLDILPAPQRAGGGDGYLGTADAVAQNIDTIRRIGAKYILILAGDHIYKQDYALLLAQHVKTGADVTVGSIEVPRAQARALGVMTVDDQDRISAFVEKPADPPAVPGDDSQSLASMGIYAFNTAFLIDLLAQDAASMRSGHDFGHDLIPALVRRGNAFAHPFSRSCVTTEPGQRAYWRDVGTIDAYWQANIDLTGLVPELNLYDQNWPIWTYSELTPPAKFVHDEDGRRGMAVSSMVAGGCIISGARLRQCLLHKNVRVNSYADLNGVVALPDVMIGRGAKLCNVVIDRGVHIPPDLVVGESAAEDARRFNRSENGICLITQSMIDRL